MRWVLLVGLVDTSMWAHLHAPLTLTCPPSPHPDGNHDVHIFDQLESGDFIDETPPLPKVHPCLPSARMVYLGIEALQV